MGSRQGPTGLSGSPGLGKQLFLTSGCDWNWVPLCSLVLTRKPPSLAPLVMMKNFKTTWGQMGMGPWPTECVSAQVFQETDAKTNERCRFIGDTTCKDKEKEQK